MGMSLLFKIIPFFFLVACAHTEQTAVSEHRLRGPYEFRESGQRVPRFFEIDGRSSTTIEALKQAVVSLPPNSCLRWSPGCMPYETIELGPKPYMSLKDFRAFCRQHEVQFIWYFGR